MDGQTDSRSDRKSDGRMDRWQNGWTAHSLISLIDRWSDGQTVGRTNWTYKFRKTTGNFCVSLFHMWLHLHAVSDGLFPTIPG